jgi:hypothetical protein
VVGARVGRIRKRRLPQFDVGCRGMEFDAGKEVSSCPINPRFGDDAIHSKRSRFVMQMVDDEIENLLWEGGRHRGLRQSRWALDLPSGRNSVHCRNPIEPCSPVCSFTCPDFLQYHSCDVRRSCTVTVLFSKIPFGGESGCRIIDHDTERSLAGPLSGRLNELSS